MASSILLRATIALCILYFLLDMGIGYAIESRTTLSILWDTLQKLAGTP